MLRENNITVRRAVTGDKTFILGLVPRLTAFGPPHWRDVPAMITTDQQILSSRLDDAGESVLFIAEDSTQLRLGFVHVHTGHDYYNKQPHGHISDVIIAPEGEGKGIARLLIDKAEQWALDNGFGWLTLSVFSNNKHACDIYEHMGFGKDIVKYVKVLQQ